MISKQLIFLGILNIITTLKIIDQKNLLQNISTNMDQDELCFYLQTIDLKNTKILYVENTSYKLVKSTHRGKLQILKEFAKNFEFDLEEERKVSECLEKFTTKNLQIVTIDQMENEDIEKNTLIFVQENSPFVFHERILGIETEGEVVLETPEKKIIITGAKKAINLYPNAIIGLSFMFAFFLICLAYFGLIINTGDFNLKVISPNDKMPLGKEY